MINPTSAIYLLSNIKIDNTYENTYSWASYAQQSSSLLAKATHTLTDFLFLRKESSVKVNLAEESINNVNYVMFKNNAKWYYAFVTDIIYINDQTSELKLELDVLQTYYFDITWKDCWIEREHVTDDTIGLHRLDENLETGETYVQNYTEVDEIEELAICVVATKTTQGQTLPDINDVSIFNGVFVGAGIYADTDPAIITTLIYDYIHNGREDAIVAIFMMPKNLISTYGATVRIPNTTPVEIIKNVPYQALNNQGYVPRNNKLLTYPYKFLLFSNNQGNVQTLGYEYFSTNSINFKITSDVTINPTVICVPKSYRGSSTSWEDALTISNYPQCPFTTDSYRNWQAQTQVSNALSIGSSGLALAGGLVSKNPLLIAGGGLGLAQTFNNFEMKKWMPNNYKGSMQGGINIATGQQTFSFYEMSISQSFAQKIDYYFDKYGYLVNTLKEPNIRTRPYYNYVKMVDVNFSANIGNKFKTMIKDIHKKGITYWKGETLDRVGDYGYDNTI